MSRFMHPVGGGQIAERLFGLEGAKILDFEADEHGKTLAVSRSA
jgi:hypothetical protein